MIITGQFHKIKCPTCGASIELWGPDEVPGRCPACDASWHQVLDKQGGGTGLTTATVYWDNERANPN